jgi:transcriptional regulator with XRE-family HTH domain
MHTSGEIAAPVSPYPELGTELLRLRLLRGLSLRRLARLIGMTAHSGLVDYERGVRIPPRDLMDLLQEVLQPPDDRLRLRYEEAISRRADRRCRALVVVPEPTAAVVVRPEAGAVPRAPVSLADGGVQTVGAVLDLIEETVVYLRELVRLWSKADAAD